MAPNQQLKIEARCLGGTLFQNARSKNSLPLPFGHQENYIFTSSEVKMHDLCTLDAIYSLTGTKPNRNTLSPFSPARVRDSVARW
jgi:hypothetical protein